MLVVRKRSQGRHRGANALIGLAHACSGRSTHLACCPNRRAPACLSPPQALAAVRPTLAAGAAKVSATWVQVQDELEGMLIK